MPPGEPHHHEHPLPHPHPPEGQAMREQRRQPDHQAPHRHLLLPPRKQPIHRDQTQNLRLTPPHHQQNLQHFPSRKLQPMRHSVPQTPQMLQLPVPERAHRSLHCPLPPHAQKLRIHQAEVDQPCPLADHHIDKSTHRSNAALQQPQSPRVPNHAQQSSHQRQDISDKLSVR